MKLKCLYCYNSIEQGKIEFHPACSKKIFGTTIPPEIDFSLDDVEELAIKVLGKSNSVTGVQPKLSLEIENQKRKKRFTIVGLWGNYIFKPPFELYSEMPEIEDLTMHLAELLNINTANHSLIRLQSGELGYLSKRYDRLKDKKLHVEDMAQLTGNLTERKYSSSMEKVSKIISKYSDYSGNDLLRLFELTLFCYLTGNADMHLKNFSLLTNEEEEVILSPAYDLVATKLLIPTDKEELALPINGKKSNLRKSDFDKFGKYLGLSEIVLNNLYKKISSSKQLLIDFIDKSFLQKETINNYKELISNRYNKLF